MYVVCNVLRDNRAEMHNPNHQHNGQPEWIILSLHDLIIDAANCSREGQRWMFDFPRRPMLDDRLVAQRPS